MTTSSDSPPSQPPVEPQAARGGIVSSGWLADHSTLETKDSRRLGRAFTVSLAVHGGLLALILAIFAVAPPATLAPLIQSIPVVYLNDPGPGGGGGGSPAPAPPKKVEIPKTKAPVPIPVAPTPPVPVPPPPPPTLSAPIMTNPQVVQASGQTSVSLSAYGGGGRGTGLGAGTGSGVGPGSGGGFGDGAYRPGSGIEGPTVIREVRPTYTAEALRAKIQGIVRLEIVVQTDGTVGDVRVLKSLDSAMGLDTEAVKAARKWLFVPGKRQGKAVPIVAVLELSFNLY